MRFRRMWVGLRLALALVLVVACGGAGQQSTSTTVGRDTSAATTAADTTTTSTARTEPWAGSSSRPSTAVGPTPADDAGTTTTTTAVPSTTTTGVDDGSSAPPAPGDVGAFATYYLGRDGAARVTVDVRSQSGAEPDSSALELVRDVLAREADKPVAVRSGSVPGDRRSWSAAQIRAEADRAAPAVEPGTGVLTVLYLRGGLTGSDAALGVAVRSDVAAVFPDRIDETAGLLGDRRRIETAVAVHEVGHVLGLVDLVLETGRAHPEHPGHSPNRDSVMYHAVESTLVSDLLSGGPPTEFDAADRRDLATIAGL